MDAGLDVCFLCFLLLAFKLLYAALDKRGFAFALKFLRALLAFILAHVVGFLPRTAEDSSPLSQGSWEKDVFLA